MSASGTVTSRVDEIARILRGGSRPNAGSVGALFSEAEPHGVGPLLHERLRHTGLVPDAIGEQYRRAAAADLVREIELQQVLTVCDARGLPLLVFKGAQAAYAWYARPDLRPRLDTDVLVRPDDRGAAEEILRSLGYDRSAHFSGDLVTYQATFTRRRDGGVSHIVDLHWRLANPQQFGRMLSVDEAIARGVPVPRLAPCARGLAPEHALFLACIHPTAHHAGAERMIWSWDVHAIASSMSAGQWDDFIALAVGRDAGPICARSLRVAQQWFGTDIPPSMLERIRTAGGRTAATGRRHVAVVFTDLRLLPNWRDRWRLVTQHLFPPPDYMRQTYAPASGAPLPVLYVKRMVRGARKWLVRP